MKHEAWIPIKPQVKERPRMGRRRKVYTPEKTINYERTLREWWHNNANRIRFEGPIYVGIEIHKEGIKVIIEELEDSVRPVGVLGDLDNYQKAVWDGLQDGGGFPDVLGAFVNDKQIQWAEIRFVGVPRKAVKPK